MVGETVRSIATSTRLRHSAIGRRRKGRYNIVKGSFYLPTLLHYLSPFKATSL